MLHDPIGQRLLEADVAPGFFRFYPLVAKYFIKLRLELLVEGGVLYQIVPAGYVSRHLGVGVLFVTTM